MATMQQFINRYGVKMDAPEWLDERPDALMDDIPPGSTHWRITIRRGRRRMVVVWSQGPAVAGEPKLADVLDAIASDAASYENARDFEDWAADLGYEPDSRKAGLIFSAVGRQSIALRRVMGDAYDELLWHTERI